MCARRWLESAVGVVATGVLAATVVVPGVALARRVAPASQAVWAYHFQTLREMATSVDVVVVAEVVSRRPGRVVRAAGSELPFTLVTLRVDQVVLGDVSPGEMIAVEQTGGGGRGQSLSVNDDGDEYTPGQRTLVFLRRQQDTTYFVLSLPRQ